MIFSSSFEQEFQISERIRYTGITFTILTALSKLENRFSLSDFDLALLDINLKIPLTTFFRLKEILRFLKLPS